MTSLPILDLLGLDLGLGLRLGGPRHADLPRPLRGLALFLSLLLADFEAVLLRDLVLTKRRKL